MDGTSGGLTKGGKGSGWEETLTTKANGLSEGRMMD
jgi:hypothetical protein